MVEGTLPNWISSKDKSQLPENAEDLGQERAAQEEAESAEEKKSAESVCQH